MPTERPICLKVKTQDKPCRVVGYMHGESEKSRWNKIVRDLMGHSVF